VLNINGFFFTKSLFLFLFFLTTLSANELSVREGQLISECPSTLQSHCNLSFKLFHRSAIIEETYILSHQDPIEVFLYESKFTPIQLRSLASPLYIKLPLFGEIRDRFIDNKPNSHTLLFSTSLFGLGFQKKQQNYQFLVDINLLHVKQRYIGNFVHSTISRDAEKNKNFAFDDPALSLQIELLTHVSSNLQFNITYKRLQIQTQQLFIDQELSALLKFYLKKSVHSRIGLHLTSYKRSNNLRFDHKQQTFQINRAGLFLEF
jgi:hypothetical protein